MNPAALEALLDRASANVGFALKTAGQVGLLPARSCIARIRLEADQHTGAERDRLVDAADTYERAIARFERRVR